MKNAATVEKVKKSRSRASEPTAEVDELGPRMQSILQHQIKPWRRDELGEEEAQLAEIRRRPVRNRFDAEEAKRRLGVKPNKKIRTSRTKQVTA
jgi:hypothetical protein